MTGDLFLILGVVLLVGALPGWAHSRGWGYAPVGGVLACLSLAIVLMLADGAP